MVTADEATAANEATSKSTYTADRTVVDVTSMADSAVGRVHSRQSVHGGRGRGHTRVHCGRGYGRDRVNGRRGVDAADRVHGGQGPREMRPLKQRKLLPQQMLPLKKQTARGHRLMCTRQLTAARAHERVNVLIVGALARTCKCFLFCHFSHFICTLTQFPF